AEIEPFMRRYVSDEALFSDLARYQKSVILRPQGSSETKHFHYRFKQYFETILSNEYQALCEQEVSYCFKTPFSTPDWDEYGRIIVWYGRRNSRMLYSSAPNKIEETEESKKSR
ncbi:MAG: hypothetical protein IJG23_01185, partial [Clostridia bacterium]|nr:hypothetical protein [Clostridia bacterium]